MGYLIRLSETGSDYSDLYFQHSIAESWVFDEGIVKDGSYSISHGVGVSLCYQVIRQVFLIQMT